MSRIANIAIRTAFLVVLVFLLYIFAYDRDALYQRLQTQDYGHDSLIRGEQQRPLEGSTSVENDTSVNQNLTISVKADTENFGDVLNRTLGFQEVFVLSLPERTDRLDAFAVQAGLTGIKFEVAHGVDGKTVLDKALPLGLERDKDGNGSIGCWRAHLNIYQKMVQDDIQTALVFEDDADWDIALKYQMLDVARGTRWLLNTTEDRTNSPYGDNWDILWIGHGSSQQFQLPREPRRWVTPNDPTVIPPGARQEFETPNMTFWDSHVLQGDLYTRILYRPRWGSVTTAYAISLRGALKMMYHQSMLPFNQTIDNGIGDMCAEPEENSNFTCIAPFPRLVAPGVPPGRGDKLTDIEGHAGGVTEEKIFTEAKSYFLMYSTKLNIDGLMRGDTTFSALYGGEVGPKEMSLDDIKRIRGHGEILVQDEFGGWLSEVAEDSYKFHDGIW